MTEIRAMDEHRRGAVVVADDDLVIRRMVDSESDYELMVKWRNRPYVRRWWDPDLPPLTISAAIEEYRPNTVPDARSIACIIELDDAPIGFIQFYKWASYADAAREVGIPFDDRMWGLDVFVGEPSQVHRGIGTRVVRMLSDYFIDELNASSVGLTTDVANHAAHRCYEKAGFRKVKEVLDTDTYRGERVWSWLMIKRPIRE